MPGAARAGLPAPEQVGRLRAAELAEVSGLAASTRRPGTFWVINDGGHAPVLHAVTAAGARVARVPLSGAVNVDWEDLASCSCPDGRVLVIADTGDNLARRAAVAVYRVVEPRVRSPQAEVLARRIDVTYPDGPHDVEAILVDPRSGGTFLVTKSRERTRLFEVATGEPATVARELPARRLGALGPVTGASVSPSGDRVVVRTYFGVFEFQRRDGESLAGAFARAPVRSGVLLELQGEAIAYSRDGRRLVTTSEGVGAPIWRFPAPPLP